jgi:EAL domain-containing protein (putative c-di-GMP-specific phosphodiesterase class I)
MPTPQMPANPASDEVAPISTFIANPQNLVPPTSSTSQAINQATINHARINKVEKRLQRALDQGEISLYYQPQVNVKTGNIEAMEALVRWQHPQQGMISPKQFLPWADNSEMVLPMSQWILTTACTQNKTWQYQRIQPLKVSVNLSDKQFYHPQLLETVTEALANSKLEPNWLELEMTESTVLRDFAISKKLMQALDCLGIQLSLDDFGVDYASIRYLQELPIHKVKIDKSFVAQLSNDPQNTMMLSALINLGQGFNIQVVAEGVETQSQLNVLQNLHCVIMQGYRFSQPLLTEDATKFLLQHHTVKL